MNNKDAYQLKKLLRRQSRQRLPSAMRTGDGNGTNLMPGHKDLAYVRSAAHDIPLVVYAGDTPDQEGLHVLVGVDPNDPGVTRILDLSRNQGGGQSELKPVLAHAATHFLNGTDPVWIDLGQIVQLLATPSALTVTVKPGWVIVAGQPVWVEKQTVSFTPPATGARYDLIRADSAGVLDVQPGAAVADFVDLAKTDIPAVAEGYVALWAVRLYEAQTAIKWTTVAPDLVDLRFAVRGVMLLSLDDLVDVTITTPADHDLLVYDTGTSKWINLSAADAIKLDDLGAPDNNTDLDATTGEHGLLPKLGGGTTNYLRADGAWADPSASAGSGTNSFSLCQGRLTLESGVPVSITDQTAKQTLYLTPFRGCQIGLYDGVSAWTVYAFTELSLDISAYTADKNYDIWAYDNSGVAALDSTIWTNDTTRATALTYQDGILVKSGDATRRYLGTIRITGTTGQCESSLVKRFVYNYYHRIVTRMYCTEATNHAYSGAIRKWNNSDTNNLLEYIVGVIEDSFNLDLGGTVLAATACYSVVVPYINGASWPTSLNDSSYLGVTAIVGKLYNGRPYTVLPTLGYSYAQVYELSNSSGTNFMAACLEINIPL